MTNTTPSFFQRFVELVRDIFAYIGKILTSDSLQGLLVPILFGLLSSELYKRAPDLLWLAVPLFILTLARHLYCITLELKIRKQPLTREELNKSIDDLLDDDGMKDVKKFLNS